MCRLDQDGTFKSCCTCYNDICDVKQNIKKDRAQCWLTHLQFCQCNTLKKKKGEISCLTCWIHQKSPFLLSCWFVTSRMIWSCRAEWANKKAANNPGLNSHLYSLLCPQMPVVHGVKWGVFAPSVCVFLKAPSDSEVDVFQWPTVNVQQHARRCSWLCAGLLMSSLSSCRY